MCVYVGVASVLVKATSACPCTVQIQVGEKTLDAKSILNIMMAAIRPNVPFTLICDGENEAESLELLAGMIESGLGD